MCMQGPLPTFFTQKRSMEQVKRKMEPFFFFFFFRASAQSVWKTPICAKVGRPFPPTFRRPCKLNEFESTLFACI